MEILHYHLFLRKELSLKPGINKEIYTIIAMLRVMDGQ